VGETAPVSAKPASAPQPKNGDGSDHPTAVAEAPKKRLNPLKRKQMEERVIELEQRISRSEDDIARLETALQSFVSAEESQRQSQELESSKASHAALVGEWEELAQELENAE